MSAANRVSIGVTAASHVRIMRGELLAGGTDGSSGRQIGSVAGGGDGARSVTCAGLRRTAGRRFHGILMRFRDVFDGLAISLIEGCVLASVVTAILGCLGVL